MKKKFWCVTGGVLAAAAGIFIAVCVYNQKAFPQAMYVNVNVCKVRTGAGEEFDTVGLLAEGNQVTALGKVSGKGGQTWYKIDKEALAEGGEITAEECFIRADLLRPDI